MWMNTNRNSTDQIVIVEYCSPEHWKTSDKMVSLQKDRDAQCEFNHAGRLCGGCKENYSLALGSSHYICCPTTTTWHSSFGLQLQDSCLCSSLLPSTSLPLKEEKGSSSMRTLSGPI